MNYGTLQFSRVGRVRLLVCSSKNWFSSKYFCPKPGSVHFLNWPRSQQSTLALQIKPKTASFASVLYPVRPTSNCLAPKYSRPEFGTSWSLATTSQYWTVNLNSWSLNPLNFRTWFIGLAAKPHLTHLNLDLGLGSCVYFWGRLAWGDSKWNCDHLEGQTFRRAFQATRLSLVGFPRRRWTRAAETLAFRSILPRAVACAATPQCPLRHNAPFCRI